MWSGPRNLSTAMMYSFGARGDCAIWDEPYYAPYLAMTGLDHPMASEIIATHETDPDRVAANCTGPIPNNKPHLYMKHMPHHMIEGVSTNWVSGCVNIHLIRHPARVIASYAAKRENPSLEDIGFHQQLALYERYGGVVVDSFDIRSNPELMLKKLCAEIELPYISNMLRWPSGGRSEDGVWAKHWYGAVHKSQGFAGPEGELPNLPDSLASLCSAAIPAYEKLRSSALLPH
jgi:sulfotransferase family protein